MDRGWPAELLGSDRFSIADMASSPLVSSIGRRRARTVRLPNMKRWFEAIAARPATVRAYEVGAKTSSAPRRR